jgi:DMSO/TMAO reductase YedYZ molybdopterin-dependent catalytic subunit
MPMTKVVSDFHCVTGWSVRNVEWEGMPLKHFAKAADIMPDTK